MHLVLKSMKYFQLNLLIVPKVHRFLITKVALFVFMSGLMFILPSCNDDNNNIIPYVPFSFSVNLNIVNDLNVPGNSVFFPNAGYGGVIIYCELPGSYYAFDATCTYEISTTCRAVNEGVLATCPCCESQFILISGAYPSRGPAEMPLKQYHVSVVNDFTVRVYN